MNTLPSDGTLFRASGERPAAPSIFDVAAPASSGEGSDFRDHLRPPASPPPGVGNPTNSEEPQDGASTSSEDRAWEPAPVSEENRAAVAEETAESPSEKPSEETAEQGAEQPLRVPTATQTEEAKTKDAEPTEGEEVHNEGEAAETAEPLVAAVQVEEPTTEDSGETASEQTLPTDEVEIEAVEEPTEKPAAKVKKPAETPTQAPTTEEQGALEPQTQEEAAEPELSATTKPNKPSAKAVAHAETETTAATETKPPSEVEGETVAAVQKATASKVQPAGETEQPTTPQAAEGEVATTKREKGVQNTKRATRRGIATNPTGKSAGTANAAAAATNPLAPTAAATAEGPFILVATEIEQATTEAPEIEAAASQGSETETKAAAPKAEPAATSAASENHPRNVLGPRRTTAPGEVRLTPAERGQFVQRVSRAIETAQERGGPIRIRLSPPELGSVRVEITIEQGVLNARLEAENPHARNLLMENLAALRERLADHQIRIESFDVELAQQQSSGQEFGQPLGERGEQQGHAPAGRLASSGNGGESEATSETPAPGPSADGHRLNVVV